MADARDLKSLGMYNSMPVRLRPAADLREFRLEDVNPNAKYFCGGFLVAAGL